MNDKIRAVELLCLAAIDAGDYTSVDELRVLLVKMNEKKSKQELEEFRAEAKRAINYLNKLYGT